MTDLECQDPDTKKSTIENQRLMIYRRHLFSMLNSCSEIEKTLLEILSSSPTKEEREFVTNVRAHIHDLCEAIKEQDY